MSSAMRSAVFCACGRALRLLAPPRVPRAGEERRRGRPRARASRSSPPRGTSGRARRGSPPRRATESSFSSHSRLATSRWFVGSSRSSRSGSPPSARASDARVSSPPEKVVERPVEVGRRRSRGRARPRSRARASRSRRRARAGLRLGVAPQRRRVVVAGGHRLLERGAARSSSRDQVGARRERTYSRSESAALERRPLVVERDARPLLRTRARRRGARSRPARMRSSVVLPAPFGPASATPVAALDLERDAVEERGRRRAPCAARCDHDGHADKRSSGAVEHGSRLGMGHPGTENVSRMWGHRRPRCRHGPGSRSRCSAMGESGDVARLPRPDRDRPVHRRRAPARGGRRARREPRVVPHAERRP